MKTAVREIVMPKLGWTMTEATIAEWFKAPGDRVEAGDSLFSIETEKVNYEVEARASGTLLRIVAGVGQVVPVGEVVAYLGSAEQPGGTV